MPNVAIDKLYNKVGSAYKLVILASLRAIELSDGAANLVGAKPEEKPINVAIKEILEGKVTYKLKEAK